MKTQGIPVEFITVASSCPVRVADLSVSARHSCVTLSIASHLGCNFTDLCSFGSSPTVPKFFPVVLLETEVKWTQTLLRRSLAKRIEMKTIVFVLYLSVDVFSIKVISFFFF